MKVHAQVDRWLVNAINNFGEKLQTEGHIHYGSIIVWPFAVLASLATLTVFAQYKLFSPLFWFALVPYLISVWPIFFVVWHTMQKDCRNWDLAKVQKWNGYCNALRNSSFIRIAGWVWLFVFGFVRFMVPPMFTGETFSASIWAAVFNLPSLVLQVGTVLAYLYIVCIRPVLPGAIVKKRDRLPNSGQVQAS
jgi:hypothetical protein